MVNASPSDDLLFGIDKMWSPTDVNQTNMHLFMSYINQKYSLNLVTYEELRQWSINNISKFWGDVWDYTEIHYSVNYEQVVDETIPLNELPEWFKGARLNYAENLLWCNDDSVAIYSLGEGHDVTCMTHRQLREEVRKCSLALKSLGVQKGDRVVGYISNCAEAVVAYLATSAIGAIWSSTSPDFGATGVLERFAQIQPKVLFSVNAVHYNGKVHDHMEKMKHVADGLDGLVKVVILNFVPEHKVDISKISNSVDYHEFLSKTSKSEPLVFEQLPFNHPLVILFSSGTTGKPKCIVHSAGGPLIQHKKEHIIHGDVSKQDIVFQYTTAGWMMWNWLISVLSTGAAIVLYDGSPFKPDPIRIWKLIDEIGITIYGTSAKYIAALEEGGIKPKDHAKLTTLRCILSTGSPLKPESFDYVYRDISSTCLLGSITGGTDIVSLFAGHNTALPVYRGEIQCRGLGMAVECWSDDGKSLMGEKGDLVCTKAFPCMPVFFWNDKDHTLYQKSYFSQFKGVWYHGDFLAINPQTQGIIMLGRSDGTLNPNGVRIGTAEIYNLIEKLEPISDSLVVGQKYKDDERVVLFLKMAQGHEFSTALCDDIKKLIRSELSPRHVPSVILPIKDIPHTINGKKVEIAVKKIISGEDVVPNGAIANPECLSYYKNIDRKSVV